jgi:protein involved in polysaccharide export with SLBB domain
MRKFVRTGWLLACGAQVMLTGCKSAKSGMGDPLPPPALAALAAPAGAPVNNLVFVPGDSLELFVKEDATLNGSYLVREGGYIVIPRAGRIQVAGLDRGQAEARVKDILQRTQLTEASVLVERTSKNTGHEPGTTPIAAMPKVMVYLTGAVPRSGVHHIPLPNGRSLGAYEALLITGGMTKFAREDRVEIFRTDSQGRRRRAVVDLRPVRLGTADDPPLGEGDIVHVPEKVFGF